MSEQSFLPAARAGRARFGDVRGPRETRGKFARASETFEMPSACGGAAANLFARAADVFSPCRERLSARRGLNVLSRGTRGVQPVPFDTLYGIRKCHLDEVTHTTASRTSPKARASFVDTKNHLLVQNVGKNAP